MDAFWISLVGVFLLELGDKTQLVAMSLASRFNAWITLAGIAAATLAVHLFSVGIGYGAGQLLPLDWIGFLAGIAFIGFGLWTYRGDCLEEGDAPKCGTRGAFWCVFTTFFLAELGDKTMLGTVALASTHSWIPVWLGSSTGMVISDGLAIVVGLVLGAKLPEKAVRIGASCIFGGFGVFSVVSKGPSLPTYSWAIAGVSTALLAYIFLRPRPKRICLTPADIVAEMEREEVAMRK